MLLQSDAGYIEPLAALPSIWNTGSYEGLVARGNFEVGCSWEDGLAQTISITSRSGGVASVKYPTITNAKVVDSKGNEVEYIVEDTNLISFETKLGETYYITGFKKVSKPNAPTNFTYTKDNASTFNFTWNGNNNAVKYNVYKAVGNAATYTLIGTSTTNSFTYNVPSDEVNVRTTFVVTAVNGDGNESERTICYANPLETVDGVVVDGIKDELYGTNLDTVLLDKDRSYTISALKTESGVFIYSQGIFNGNIMDKANPNWYVKTNFEFRLNGGNTSYVNVLNQNSGVTHFKYNVKELENGKYEHTVEIFITKELISNWSDTLDVQINYAWKTPNENAYIKSEMLDSRYADWNTDWHSYHKFGALETSYMSLQANLFASKTGLNIIK